VSPPVVTCSASFVLGDSRDRTLRRLRPSASDPSRGHLATERASDPPFHHERGGLAHQICAVYVMGANIRALLMLCQWQILSEKYVWSQ
jgi:hypothetical protein